MFFRLFSLLFLLHFILTGCAPEGASKGPSAPDVYQPLPERPTEQTTAILNRDLLFRNDARISYCEIIESQKETYSGMRDTTLEPLASLSKLITTSWALEKLGTDFRFMSEIYLNPVKSGGVYDVYLKTGYDPIVNIEKLLFFIAHMHQSGVRQIRNLVIDESTRIFLGVLSNPHSELANIPISTSETIENLKLIFNSKSWAEKTKVARSHFLTWAQKNKSSLVLPEQFSVDSISFLLSTDIQVQNFAAKITLYSGPLFKYLKNINVNSNNYVADALFGYLGGAKSFKSFQKNKLGLTEKDLQVFTGSGLSDASIGFRQDNLGSCFSMIRVLGLLKNKAKQSQLNLGSLLLNPSLDQDGTFDTNSNYKGAAVLKTGRLFEVPAFNLAGFVSTSRGVVSFVFLGHDFDEAAANEMENYRGRMLDDIFSQYHVRSDFGSIEYSNIFF